MASPILQGWRGVAHYRTENRRKIFEKNPEDRTNSELYILEETVSHNRLISDLPLVKRLEVCKHLAYQAVPEETVVFKEGDLGSEFYILFTGSVVVTIDKKDAKEGTPPDVVAVLYSGDSFGELALLNDNNLRTATVTTKEKCELLTLTKKDFDSILKFVESEETRERVHFLKSIPELRKLPLVSLQRLAQVLTPRSFPKNRVITLQGEDADDMFFIKYGECRVVMETFTAHKDAIRMPRVASLIPQVKKKIDNREQNNWWRPRQQRLSSHHAPVKVRIAGRASQRLSRASKLPSTAISVNVDPRKDSTVKPETLSEQERAQSPDSPSSETTYSESRKVGFAREGPASRQAQTPDDTSLRSQVQMQNGPRSSKASGNSVFGFGPPRRSNKKSMDIHKTSLTAFVKDLGRRQRLHFCHDLDFVDREQQFWHSSTSQRFQKWVTRVISRERSLLAERVLDQALQLQRILGAVKAISASQKFDIHDHRVSAFTEDTTVLDIGQLHAGQYFGEMSLYYKSTRAASIVSVSPVDVLVLNKWDFHRHLDKDLMDCFSSHEFDKGDNIYKQYKKACRWELYKVCRADLWRKFLDALNTLPYEGTTTQQKRIIRGLGALETGENDCLVCIADRAICNLVSSAVGDSFQILLRNVPFHQFGNEDTVRRTLSIQDIFSWQAV